MEPARLARLVERARQVEAQGLRRRLRPLQPTGPTTARVGDREVHVFSSNDYLGLAWTLRDEWRGGGGTSSRLIAGDRPAHHRLEDVLEAHFGQPALVFPSGFQANLAVLTTLFGSGDHVASDALNHASIIDGLRLSKCQREILTHGHPPAAGVDGVVVEGLYSMDGDQLPLSDYTGEHCLMVDEAHAVGVLGPGGRGAAAAQGVTPDVRVGTFGKAFGAAGAFVLGPAPLKELLISQGRAFVYTTGLAEAAANAALAGLHAATDERRARLRQNVLRFRAGVSDLGLRTAGVDHVVPVILGERTMEAARALDQRGIWVPGIRAPTVPAGLERLRFSLSAEHTNVQIDIALEALEACSR